ncbi:MAG: hypothetical protein HY796_06605 [Elusimicrobia bacterium]|nr:hypothetical protein [Elusimicrobiota bacterium]
MLKETLKELLHFWKILFLAGAGIVALLIIYQPIDYFFIRKGGKHLEAQTGGLKDHFLKNRAQFEEILNRLNGDKRIFCIGRSGPGKTIIRKFDVNRKMEIIETIPYSAGVTVLNDFRIGYYGIDRDIIRIDYIGNRPDINRINPADLNELYGYYGLKKEEVQWYVDKLGALKYDTARKSEIPVEDGVKNKVVEFRKSAVDRGIIYNPENKLPGKRPNGRYKFWEVFERIDNNWFLYIGER